MRRLHPCPKNKISIVKKILNKNPHYRYIDIIREAKQKYSTYIKTCWIADVKEQMGYPVKVAHNRK